MPNRESPLRVNARGRAEVRLYSMKRKVIALYSCPQTAEFAVASDGTVWARWYENKGRYGYGWTKWRPANEDERGSVAGDPEFFRYGFHSTFQRFTSPELARLRLPQASVE